MDTKPLELQVFDIKQRVTRYASGLLQEDRTKTQPYTETLHPPISLVSKFRETTENKPEIESISESLDWKSPPVHQQSLFSFCSPDEKMPSVQSLCTSSEDDCKMEAIPAFLSSNQSVGSFTLGKSRTELGKSAGKAGGRIKTQVTPLKEDFKEDPTKEDLSLDGLQWIPDRHKLSVETLHESGFPPPASKRSVLGWICPCLVRRPERRHK